MLAVLLATLGLIACEGGTSARAPLNGPLSPSDVVGVKITPAALTVAASAALACSFGPAVATVFGLEVVPSASRRVTLDRVTVRLVDGSHLGGPMVTFPRPELDRMFGSTVFAGSRTFTFQPSFGCGVSQPRALSAELAIVDENGAPHTVTVSAPFR